MARAVPVTPTYRPPESDIGNQLVSLSGDIWALGCVFLEFLWWFLEGWDLVVEFSHRRGRYDWDLIKEDKFFDAMTADLTVINELRDSRRVLKPAVVQVSLYSSRTFLLPWCFPAFLCPSEFEFIANVYDDPSGPINFLL